MHIGHQIASTLTSALFVFTSVVPVFSALALSDTRGILLNGGRQRTLPMVSSESADYLSIEETARLAGAHVRWQPVAGRACISNARGEMCFEWQNSLVTMNGKKLLGTSNLRYENSRLLIPLSLITSYEFSTFSQHRYEWEKEQRFLTQKPQVNLKLSTVVKENDRYRLTMNLPHALPHYLIERNDNTIWLRFTNGKTEGDQVFTGDRVIQEVRVNQKRHSADVIVKLGPDAASNDVYYDEEKKSIIIDVTTTGTAQEFAAEKPQPIETPAPKKKAKRKVEVVRVVKKPEPAIVAAIPLPAMESAPVVKRVPVRELDGKQTIVIDAGHGGLDSGAIGIRGTLEKDVNLEVAKMLAKELSKEKNVRVIMTRDSDEFIPLNGRTEIANKANADLFISVHCNSSLSPKNDGFETYFLSPDATDKAAEAVARLENSVVSLEREKSGASSRLAEMLASMAVYNHINESSKFASHVTRHVKNKCNVDTAHVKEADFYVLRGAQMPAVLVELEYLSNPVSELKLRSSRFRKQITKAIIDGVLAYDRSLKQEREAIAAQPRSAPVKSQQ